jgi:hypothetical protein
MTIFILHEFAHYLRVMVIGFGNLLTRTPDSLSLFEKEVNNYI